MYYLKYRPQKIAEIDNTDRRLLLTKIFQNNSEIPHAFLLTGPKGTGKTSTARIIAKILNCENNIFAKKNKSPEPCNKCSACLAITKNIFLDVYELDGATNRGIDEIRALKESIAFSPVNGRFKIFIIDEVHMLTKEAFNALLKTLEEPPQAVIFILATTEPQKLPGTITSRCLSLYFKKATVDELVFSLDRIVKAEKIEISAKALEKIGKAANGSFRDAAKILETIVRTSNLTDDSIDLFIRNGTVEEPLVLLEYLVNKQTKEALSWLLRFSQNGGSMQWLIEELLNLLHDLLLIKREILIDEEGLFKKIKLTFPEISRLIKLLLEAYQQSKYSPIESLPLMLAVSDFL